MSLVLSFDCFYQLNVELHLEEYDNDFRKLLHLFDNQLPFKDLSNLGSKEISECIHTATKGIMRNIKDLIREASKISIYLDLNHISQNCFAEAFDKILCNTGENVFNS